MVLGSAMCALNLATSVLANGVCCYYDLHKEEDRKKEQDEAIRQAIRTEWDRHRHMDMLQRKLEKKISVNSVHLQEERRRKLMTHKASIAGSDSVPVDSDFVAVHRTFDDSSRQRIRSSTSIKSTTTAVSTPLPKAKAPEDPEVLKSSVSINVRKRYNQGDYPQRRLSSLLDDSEDEDDFEDIFIE